MKSGVRIRYIERAPRCDSESLILGEVGPGCLRIDFLREMLWLHVDLGDDNLNDDKLVTALARARREAGVAVSVACSPASLARAGALDATSVGGLWEHCALVHLTQPDDKDDKDDSRLQALATQLLKQGAGMALVLARHTLTLHVNPTLNPLLFGVAAPEPSVLSKWVSERSARVERTFRGHGGGGGEELIACALVALQAARAVGTEGGCGGAGLSALLSSINGQSPARSKL